jgi:hypothetical protein
MTMPIDCEGYIINSSKAWSRKAEGSAALKAKPDAHAERQAWGKLPGSTAHLLVQNAFPCSPCHAFFLAQSKNGHSIIIKVTANEGAYSADHGLGLKVVTPYIIYYHAGTAQYDSLSLRMKGGGGAHAAFPAHPDFTDL